MIGFREDVEALGARMVDDLRQELIMQGHNATGRLSKSLKHDVKITSNAIVLSIEGENYAKWVEHGRKAGKRPPVDVIYKWVVTKGISAPDKSQRDIAYAIATAIGRDGTPLRGSYNHSPSGRRKGFIEITLKRNKDDIEGAVKLFGEKAIRTITKQIQK